MKIIEDVKLNYGDVSIRPKRSVVASRANVNLLRKFRFYWSPKELECLPIIASNMYCVGSFEMGRALEKFKAITCLHKFYSLEELREFYKTPTEYVWVTIGSRPQDIEKLKTIFSFCSPNVCIDVANGHTDKFVETCSKVRDIVGNSILMAGNVCTPEMVDSLILQGKVDIVKCGISSGGNCQSFSVTGVGYPQLSCNIECSESAHGLKSEDKRLGLICADGGCKTSGDICKSFGSGSDFTMLGGMLAGTSECIGEWVYCADERTNLDIKLKLKFYGMSSDHAQITHYGKKVEYAASEGRVSWVEYKGPVEEVIKEIQGGIRSFCSYVGADSLKDCSRRTTFVRIR